MWRVSTVMGDTRCGISPCVNKALAIEHESPNCPIVQDRCLEHWITGILNQEFGREAAIALKSVFGIGR